MEDSWMIRFMFMIIMVLSTEIYADQSCNNTLQRIEQNIRHQSQIGQDISNQEITLEQEASYAKKLRAVAHKIAEHKDVESFLKLLSLSEDIRGRILKEFPMISQREYEEANDSVGVALLGKVPADLVVKVLLREVRLLSGSAGIMLTSLYLYSQEGFKPHDPEILDFFKEQAEEGSPRWQFEYGKILLHGIGTAENKAEGLKFLEKSNTEEALMELSHYYEHNVSKI